MRVACTLLMLVCHGGARAAVCDLAGVDPVLLLGEDLDGDGLADLAELAMGSDAAEPDTDGDGLSDGEEFFGVDGLSGTGDETDPVDADSDDDGLSDAEDIAGRDRLSGTPDDQDPCAWDTDGDGLSDGLERGALSAVPGGFSQTYGMWFDGSDVAMFVADGDAGATRTDPTAIDTDGDGLPDGVEDADLDGLVDEGETAPSLADTDGDDVMDGTELLEGTDPLDRDTDGDGLMEGDEIRQGTDPLVVDTDGDGIGDGDEGVYGTDPLSVDSDGDGLEDGTELTLGTVPTDPDTDGDGLLDGDEVVAGTNPLGVEDDTGVVVAAPAPVATVIAGASRGCATTVMGGPWLLAMLALLACRGSPDDGNGQKPDDSGPATTSDSATDTAVDPGTPVQTTTSGPILCADPTARDEARFDMVEAVGEAAKPAWVYAAGLVFGDFDDDGYVDAIIPGGYNTYYYVGLPDGTLDWATSRLAHLTLDLATGGSMADYDGDGDLDVLITRYLATDVLLSNVGGDFVDVTESAGLSLDPHRTTASAWADFDRDGDLDLWTGGYGVVDDSGIDHSTFLPGDPSKLYRYAGDGTFTDISDTLPDTAHHGYTFAGGWHDMDADGWPELYIVNDFGVAYPNALFWNRQGTLVADAGASGLDVAITGMGLASGDLNGDERPDLLMTQWDGLVLLESSGFDTWFDWAPVRNLKNDPERNQLVAWGADFADVDNDGDLDANVGYGFLATEYDPPLLEPDALYIQEGGIFTDEADAWGVADLIATRGAVVADLDNDGWIDIAKANANGPARVMRSRCGDNAWLRVQLRWEGSANTRAIGARVRVVHEQTSQIRTIYAGGTSMASAGPPEAHFGLGDLDAVTRLEVEWPDGERSVLENIDTRQVLIVRR